MAENCTQIDAEPLRCVVQLDVDGTIGVALINGCSREEAHEMCEMIARCDPRLEQVAVLHVQCCCAVNRSR